MERLPRPEKKRINGEILILLQSRSAAGPPEPALDAFIPELEAVGAALHTSVDAQGAAAAALKAILAKLDAADVDVDTWLRHHYYFIDVEATRRAGPHVAGAQALGEAAFPDDLEHVDDFIPDENELCRKSIAAIRSPEHAATVVAIGLPSAWTDAWAAAVVVSDALFNEVQTVRAGKSVHVIAGQDAEVAFVDVMTRLKRYIGSRASLKDTVKVAQGQLLIQPLLDALAKMRAEERARATRKDTAKKGKGKEAEKDKPAPVPATPAPATPDAKAPDKPVEPPPEK